MVLFSIKKIVFTLMCKQEELFLEAITKSIDVFAFVGSGFNQGCHFCWKWVNTIKSFIRCFSTQSIQGHLFGINSDRSGCKRASKWARN